MNICSVEKCENKHCAKGLCAKHREQFRKYGKAVISIYEIPTDTRFKTRIKINQESGCWDWISTCDGSGYGEFRINGKLTKAHRYSYEKKNGHIPKGMNVLHRCDRPVCVNPDHLFLGTQRENIKDMDSKGRRKPAFGSRNGNSKLKEREVMALKSFLSIRTSVETLHILFKVSKSTIIRIKNGQTWSHI